MNIWTIANQKGGVGKTTTTVNLAGLLATHGKKVLLIDLDPHGSMTSYFGYNPDTLEESVYNLFDPEFTQSNTPIASLLKRTTIQNIDLLPASTSMVSLDRRVATQEGMGLVIKRAMQQYEKYYEYVLIDCPPVLGILMINALAACQRLIIPVQTEHLAIKGLERMLNTLKMVVMTGKHSLEYLIVPTMFDQRTRAAKQNLHILQTDFSEHLWNSCIPVDTKLREASQKGKPINYLYPDSNAARAYHRLLASLLQASAPQDEPVEELA